MAVHMYTQLYLVFFLKAKNTNFCNLRGKSPLENELVTSKCNSSS